MKIIFQKFVEGKLTNRDDKYVGFRSKFSWKTHNFQNIRQLKTVKSMFEVKK